LSNAVIVPKYLLIFLASKITFEPFDINTN
jgi:hypothetical protein